MLLTSHSEGVPRVVAESLLVATPCIVSKSLRSGIQHYLTADNSIHIEDDLSIGASQILDGLNNYHQYRIDSGRMRALFCETTFRPQLREYLSKLIDSSGYPVEGKWYLNDLHLRLACHGQKHNYQFLNNETLFFDWMRKIGSLGACEPDEDILFGSEPLLDDATCSLGTFTEYVRARVLNPLRHRLLG